MKWASSWDYGTFRPPKTHSSYAHVQPSSGARCLIFGRTLRLLPYFMCANSEDSDGTARMRRLARAFAGRLCDKYHNLMSWLKLYIGMIWCSKKYERRHSEIFFGNILRGCLRERILHCWLWVHILFHVTATVSEQSSGIFVAYFASARRFANSNSHRGETLFWQLVSPVSTHNPVLNDCDSAHYRSIMWCYDCFLTCVMYAVTALLFSLH